MTEKRFNLWDMEGTAFIEDHKEGSYHIGKTEDVDINSLRDITKRLNIYADENKQLKSDNNRLVNETAKIVAEHQSKILDLIDDKIDELEGRYKFGQEVYRGCPMHNIRFGINTLKELKKELIE